jgi:hypothetical protein
MRCSSIVKRYITLFHGGIRSHDLHALKEQGRYVAHPNVAFLNVAWPNVAYGGMLFFCPWLG